MTSSEGCIKLIDDREDKRDEHISELHYQVEILKVKKDQFLRLEVEIEKKLNIVEAKDIMRADEGTMQDGNASTSHDGLGGEPTHPLAEMSDDTQVDEVANSHEGATDSDDDLSVSGADEEGKAEAKASDSKPSTSHKSIKTEHSELLASIVEIFENKTKVMMTEMKLGIATNARDLKAGINEP